jgi:hypothetical protein
VLSSSLLISWKNQDAVERHITDITPIKRADENNRVVHHSSLPYVRSLNHAKLGAVMQAAAQFIHGAMAAIKKVKKFVSRGK